MKVFSIIMKIVAALAMVAGIVYVVATYGDKIVAWAKKLLGKLDCCCDECCCDDEDCCCDGECCCDDEDCCCDDECCEEAPTEEAVAVEETAEESDFEG